MQDYEISYELFKELNKHLPEEEIDFCFGNLKHQSARNILFFQCLEYTRSKEMFLHISDYQYYYSVEIKDYENDYEPHPTFNNSNVQQAVFDACEFIMNYKGTE